MFGETLEHILYNYVYVCVFLSLNVNVQYITLLSLQLHFLVTKHNHPLSAERYQQWRG